MATMIRTLPLLTALTACTGSTTTGDSVPDSGSTTGATPAPDLVDLVDEGGCSDLVMTLGSTAGDRVLVFTHLGGLAQAAYEDPSGTASATVDLSASAELVLWQGTEVTALVCNDALSGTEKIEETWTVVSGTAVVDVVSLGEHEPWDAYPGTGTLVLTDAVLRAEGAEDVVIPSLTWSANIGWLPG